MDKGQLSHLEVAGGVEEQVGGLQVPVKNIGRVDVLQATQNLNKKQQKNLLSRGSVSRKKIRVHCQATSLTKKCFHLEGKIRIIVTTGF